MSCAEAPQLTIFHALLRQRHCHLASLRSFYRASAIKTRQTSTRGVDLPRIQPTELAAVEQPLRSKSAIIRFVNATSGRPAAVSASSQHLRDGRACHRIIGGALKVKRGWMAGAMRRTHRFVRFPGGSFIFCLQLETCMK